MEGIFHTPSLPQVFREWCEHVSPKSHFLHLPENLSPTQSKEFWWPLVVSRVTQVRDPRFQERDIFFFTPLFSVGVFFPLHEKLGNTVFILRWNSAQFITHILLNVGPKFSSQHPPRLSCWGFVGHLLVCSRVGSLNVTQELVLGVFSDQLQMNWGCVFLSGWWRWKLPAEQVLAGQDGGGPVVIGPDGSYGDFHQVFLSVNVP